MVLNGPSVTVALAATADTPAILPASAAAQILVGARMAPAQGKLRLPEGITGLEAPDAIPASVTRTTTPPQGSRETIRLIKDSKLKDAPKDVQKFVADPEHRKAALTKGVEAMKKAPAKYLKQLAKTAKHEVHEFKTADGKFLDDPQLRRFNTPWPDDVDASNIWDWVIVNSVPRYVVEG